MATSRVDHQRSNSPAFQSCYFANHSVVVVHFFKEIVFISIVAAMATQLGRTEIVLDFRDIMMGVDANFCWRIAMPNHVMVPAAYVGLLKFPMDSKRAIIQNI